MNSLNLHNVLGINYQEFSFEDYDKYIEIKGEKGEVFVLDKGLIGTVRYSIEVTGQLKFIKGINVANWFNLGFCSTVIGFAADKYFFAGSALETVVKELNLPEEIVYQYSKDFQQFTNEFYRLTTGPNELDDQLQLRLKRLESEMRDKNKKFEEKIIHYLRNKLSESKK